MRAQARIGRRRRIAILAASVAALALLAAGPQRVHAHHTPDFTIDPPGCQVPCTVTVTDASSYPPGEQPNGPNAVTWQFDNGDRPVHPPETRATGSPATFTFTRPGTREISMSSWTNVDINTARKQIVIAPKPPPTSCGEVCLLAVGPFVGPDWLEFEVPADTETLTGTWRQAASSTEGVLGEARSLDRTLASGGSIWDALLPPVPADGVVDLEVVARRSSGEIVSSEFVSVPVLARAVDLEFEVGKSRHAYLPTLKYVARREVQTRMISILYGTKPDRTWRRLAKRDIEEPGIGEATHRNRFPKPLADEKCHDHQPCRIVTVAFLLAEGYWIDGFISIDDV